MGGIAQWIEAGQHLQGDGGIGVPYIGLGDTEVPGEAPGTIHPHTAGAGAQVSAPGQAVAAVTADQMPLSADHISGVKILDQIPYRFHGAGELVTDDQRNRYVLPGPFVPVVDMHIRAADRCLVDLDQDIGQPDLRFGNLLQPESGFCNFLYQGFHACSTVTLQR